MHDSESQRSSDSAARGPVSASPSVGEALVLGSALAKLSKSAGGERKGLPDRVTVRQRQRNGRRGVILVFVVVLLTLLGIMGTAYLASSRLDRQAIIGRGSLTGTSTALLKDTTTLDKLQTGVEQAAEQAMIRDLFNVAPNADLGSNQFKVAAFGAFRQTVSTPAVPVPWYRNYDAPGRADAWLASLLPTRLSATDATPVWPWITAPLGTPTGQMLPGTSARAEAYFSDPRRMTNNGPNASFNFATFDPAEASPGVSSLDNAAVTQRHLPAIYYVEMDRTAAADSVRMYPGIVLNGFPVTQGNAVIAGDADGDGIADSALMPLRIHPEITTGNVVNQYLDTTNNVIYYAAYRIVDNSAKLNLATALDVRGDVTELAIIPSTTEGADSGNHSTSGGTAYANPPTGTTTGTPELREYLTEDPNTGNTAPPSGNTMPADGTFGPNYGFFRANVGLTGLLRGLMTPLNQVNDNNDSFRVPFQQDLRRLIDLRFPLLKQNPVTAGTYPYQQTPMSDNKDIQNLAYNFTSAALAQMKIGTTNATSVAVGAPEPAIYPLQYHYRSFGDLLEQQVARRPSSPGGYLWQTSTTASPMVATNSLTMLGFGDTASLSTKGGSLVNDLVSPGSAEQALLFSMRMSTPNVNNNGDAPWGWFPPNAMNLWFGWTQDFDVVPGVTPPSIIATDATLPQDRAFDYSFGNNANQIGLATDPNALASKPAGTANVVLQRSPRVLFTTYSGITSTTPMRGDQQNGTGTVPTLGLPIGMPAYSVGKARDGASGGHAPAIPASAVGQDPSSGMTYFTYPNVKVSAATGTKEQLWRAYWSAMTQQVPFTYLAGGVSYQASFWDAARRSDSYLWTAYNPSQFYDAFRAPDRYGSDEFASTLDSTLGYESGGTYDNSARPDQVMSTRQMALIRSAVAACNTIDLRDSDNDITAMDVDVTDNNVAGTRYYARVYGTEKQLVISGIYMRGGTATQKYVAVEIYNPTDIPIQLSAYRLALLQRRAATSNKTDGVIDTPAGLADPIRLSTDATQFVQPGGYVVIYSNGTLPTDPGYTGPMPGTTTSHTPPLAAPDTYVITPTARDGGAPGVAAATNLDQLESGTFELVLARTRRADGHPFTDATAAGTRGTIENERANDATGVEDVGETAAIGATAGAAVTDVRTLVTLDAVDCRFAFPAAATPIRRFVYQRQRPAFTPTPATTTANAPLDGTESGEQLNAWRCFYAGQFYVLRTPSAGPRIVSAPTPTATDPTFAWQDATTTTVTFAPTVTLGPPTGTYAAGLATVLAPAIPIQNFRPYDPYTESNVRTVSATPLPNTAYGVAAYNAAVTASPAIRGIFHLVNEFPYGSPFAREMDLQAVPYIGTYKIFRTGGGTTDLYDFVPLPMDAVNVAPLPDQAAPVGNPTGQITTVGRFDPRPTTPLDNAWAASLTDFVTARHAPYYTYFPDVPAVTLAQTFANTQEGVALTGDQRYAQDGPVTGSGAAVNPNAFNDVSWVSFIERGAADSSTSLAPYKTGQRMGIDTKTGSGSLLIQGIINVNTAPQIVLRQLPWLVTPTTGQVDFLGVVPTSAAEGRLRATVNSIVADPTGRDAKAMAPWTPSGVGLTQTFGFPSLAALNDSTIGIATVHTNGNPQGESITSNLLKDGMLNPVNRPEALADYQLDQLNIARVSNLISTRSDVYTVYVTVQAWTWVGGTAGANQATDTRLVGERRSSFVVDRSKIDPDHIDLSNLIVLPIERE